MKTVIATAVTIPSGGTVAEVEFRAPGVQEWPSSGNVPKRSSGAWMGSSPREYRVYASLTSIYARGSREQSPPSGPAISMAIRALTSYIWYHGLRAGWFSVKCQSVGSIGYEETGLGTDAVFIGLDDLMKAKELANRSQDRADLEALARARDAHRRRK